MAALPCQNFLLEQLRKHLRSFLPTPCKNRRLSLRWFEPNTCHQGKPQLRDATASLIQFRACSQMTPGAVVCRWSWDICGIDPARWTSVGLASQMNSGIVASAGPCGEPVVEAGQYGDSRENHRGGRR